MEKKIIGMFLTVFFLGATTLLAFEPGEPKSEAGFKGALGVEGRGWVNVLTSPAELVYAYLPEKKDHPKAWPLTYIPMFFTKIVTRVSSGVNDILVMPWLVAAKGDPTPLTRRFEMPDYVWQKDL